MNHHFGGIGFVGKHGDLIDLGEYRGRKARFGSRGEKGTEEAHSARNPKNICFHGRLLIAAMSSFRATE
jgi:hypothetical protein